MTWMNCQILLAVCALYQQVAQLFEGDLLLESTLWVGHRGDTWIPKIDVREQGAYVKVVVTIPQLDTECLEIRLTPETVLLRGVLMPPALCQNYFDFEFCLGQFQTLIPLPVMVEPRSAIAHAAGDHLTIILSRAWKGRRSVKVPIVATTDASSDFALSACSNSHPSLTSEP
ncbi:MAG: Hsp20/alpha crystallin family protein [Leptolyngbyaceae cyanobacterium]